MHSVCEIFLPHPYYFQTMPYRRGRQVFLAVATEIQWEVSHKISTAYLIATLVHEFHVVDQLPGLIKQILDGSGYLQLVRAKPPPPPPPPPPPRFLHLCIGGYLYSRVLKNPFCFIENIRFYYRFSPPSCNYNTILDQIFLWIPGLSPACWEGPGDEARNTTTNYHQGSAEDGQR